MNINSALRKEIESVLPSDYRKVIVSRLRKKGIKVHRNTVSNSWKHGTNEVVLLEILELAKECKEQKDSLHKNINENLKQLSAA
jgi:hypothetical protein